MPNNTKQHGFNLIELMVAMIIGIFLIAGALRVYTQSQAALYVSTQNARLQETARYAMSTIEKDVRSVDLWGLTNRVATIGGKGTPGAGGAPLYNVQNGCQLNWAVNLDVGIEGGDNANPYGPPCIPASEYMAGTDVLTLRHAESTELQPGDLQPGELYVRSSAVGGTVFVGNAIPTNIAADGITSRLTSVAYWISDSSDADADTPSLRRSYLTVAGGQPAVITEEVISGVEDLQVQLGVDTTGDNSINSYLNFDEVTNPDSILVARVWLRVRSLEEENGFEDDATFSYAGESYTASEDQTNDSAGKYRRILLTKTIELRNRRPAIAQNVAAGP